jgi:hypothetical protein
MIPKISLAAAFVLMVAPPMACASNHEVANSAPITRQANHSLPKVVLAQDGQDAPSMGTTDSDNDNSDDNDNDSNDSADDNQNGDRGQTDQNAAGDDQTIPPSILGPDNDQSEPRTAPQVNSYPQPVNPYQ